MFGKLINILKENPKKIVFTEGSDPRILEAASRLLASTFLSPILVGNKDEIAKAAEESAFNIRGAEIIDPMEYEGIDEMASGFNASAFRYSLICSYFNSAISLPQYRPVFQYSYHYITFPRFCQSPFLKKRRFF